MLVGQPNAEKLADEIVARGLNVRQVEEIARQESGRNGKSPSRKRSAEKNADTLALEKRMSDALGLVVSIDDRGESGVVSIRYRNLEQLDDLAQRLEKKRH
jgi:ParB family chromosome partitioning protein